MLWINSFIVASFLTMFSSSEGPRHYLDYPSRLLLYHIILLQTDVGILNSLKAHCLLTYILVQYQRGIGTGENHCHLLGNKEIVSCSNSHQRAKEDVGLSTILSQITAF